MSDTLSVVLYECLPILPLSLVYFRFIFYDKILSTSCLIVCDIIFFVQALHWLTSLGGSHHSSPSLCMYNVFLNGCTKMQSVTHTLSCLKLMEDQLMGKSEITYWELLQVCISAYTMEDVAYSNMGFTNIFND